MGYEGASSLVSPLSTCVWGLISIGLFVVRLGLVGLPSVCVNVVDTVCAGTGVSPS